MTTEKNKCFECDRPVNKRAFSSDLVLEDVVYFHPPCHVEWRRRNPITPKPVDESGLSRWDRANAKAERVGRGEEGVLA